MVKRYFKIAEKIASRDKARAMDLFTLKAWNKAKYCTPIQRSRLTSRLAPNMIDKPDDHKV